ncbi:outer membrane beta-barrel protein [Mangrovimonas sp. AS39]|uniref:outer membrane beta-barrel family protein n=1 Tax=Mangrovimonas futianensis TaxID=2895523 RepID=UPI001E34C92A|nr:outer membrane beta-barrel family protein [Mangrovimonas futianensis]MCF1191617.1 outer membrane beta-barrel protein [Mangrovimonas futianensis]MCF1195495.1 outer membrane beta-barrel protein [Mangrovimonas futianensis]
MNKYLLLALTFIFTTVSLSAQPEKNITVTGKVIDQSSKQPLEYATIAFYSASDNQLVTGGVTDENGNFELTLKSGIYNVTIEFMSFKKKTLSNQQLSSSKDFGTISLEPSTEALDEVEIIAEKTTVEIQLDKKIYNIGKDLTTAGGTVSDALNNVPSVSVDVEGAISLRGNENVRILINGKPSAMAGFGDTNLLSQLPAEAIERVEVITSPSARYDAEGTAGILNIILRQKETLGFNGSVNLTVGHPDNVSTNFNLNYRTEKYNLFSNVGWRYFDAPRISFNDATYFPTLDEDGNVVQPTYDRVREDQDVERLNRNYNANVGMEYFLSKKTSLTGSIFYRYGSDADLSLNTSDRFSNGSNVERTLRREKQTESDNSYQISLNYITKFDDKGHQLTADFQYENDKEDQYTNYNEFYVFTNQIDPEDIAREQIFTTEDQNEFLFQVDYVKPLGENGRFEAGYRGNFQNQVTDYKLEQEDANGNYVVNDTLTNIFDYTQNINAIYSQYGNKIGRFSYLLGLRFEQTQLKGDISSLLTQDELQEAFGFPIETKFDNKFFGVFPTVNIIYNLAGSQEDSEENLSFGYNRRVNRPRSWFINPFPSRSSRTNVFQGNPNLDPAFASAFDLGYLKRWGELTLTSSVYYQYESDSVEWVEENTGYQTSDGIDIIRTIPVNLSSNTRIGGELGLMYNPTKWLRLNSSFNFFQFETKGDFNDVNYDTKNTSWFARFSSKVSLPWKIDWQTNAHYRGPQQDAQTYRKGMFAMDLAFSKEIMNDNATISLNVRDVFNSRKRLATTTTDFFERYSENQWRQRSINLSFIYRFNQQKRQQQRNRGNGDMNGDMEFDG